MVTSGGCSVFKKQANAAAAGYQALYIIVSSKQKLQSGTVETREFTIPVLTVSSDVSKQLAKDDSTVEIKVRQQWLLPIH